MEYIPIVDPLRKDVGLPWKPIWDWYHGWADRGIWENRVALMSYVRSAVISRHLELSRSVKNTAVTSFLTTRFNISFLQASLY